MKHLRCCKKVKKGKSTRLLEYLFMQLLTRAAITIIQTCKASIKSVDSSSHNQKKERLRLISLMASKRPTDDELMAQFESIDQDQAGETVPAKSSPDDQQPETDLFEDLGLPERPKPLSRPHTPRLASSSANPSIKSSPKRPGASTPPDPTRAAGDDKGHLRKSAESARSFHTSLTPTTEAEAEPETKPEGNSSSAPQPSAAPSAQSQGGGWWGGIFATASAAVKQAEALAKEIQHNEEAQRWAEQVKGNVGALRGLGTSLVLRAL